MLTITEAARSGSQRDLLVALRERIARTVEDDTCAPRDLASLSLRLTQINKEIENLDALVASDAEGSEPSHHAEDHDPEAFDPSAI